MYHCTPALLALRLEGLVRARESGLPFLQGVHQLPSRMWAPRRALQCCGVILSISSLRSTIPMNSWDPNLLFVHVQVENIIPLFWTNLKIFSLSGQNTLFHFVSTCSKKIIQKEIDDSCHGFSCSWTSSYGIQRLFKCSFRF